MGCRRESMAACDVSINIPARRLIEYGAVRGSRVPDQVVTAPYGYARLLSSVLGVEL